MTTWAAKTANAMKLPEGEIEILRYAGLLHDLGKVGIPDSILLKPGELVDKEWDEIKKHPVKSVGIVKFVSFLKEALPIIQHHHERFDGKGYPDGIAGREIPLGARIIAICDTFDAITSKRPYRDKRTTAEAIEIIKKCSGSQFDPDIVSTFIGVVENE